MVCPPPGPGTQACTNRWAVPSLRQMWAWGPGWLGAREAGQRKGGAPAADPRTPGRRPQNSWPRTPELPATPAPDSPMGRPQMTLTRNTGRTPGCSSRRVMAFRSNTLALGFPGAGGGAVSPPAAAECPWPCGPIAWGTAPAATAALACRGLGKVSLKGGLGWGSVDPRSRVLAAGGGGLTPHTGCIPKGHTWGL